ncbi:hypothetical protein BDZ89DRAFT_1035321 [Hymenopellis radicata]|nr:hypothetical protein BDZ89DRAFT_1035321 [Hymenopellis radicata]
MCAQLSITVSQESFDGDSSSDSESSAGSVRSAAKKAKLENIYRIGKHLLASGGVEQILPPPHAVGQQDFAFRVLDDLDPSPVVVLRRPRGYGLRTFVSTVAHVYDENNSRAVVDAFIRDNVDGLDNPTCRVLRLDFSLISADPASIAQSLRDYVHSQLRLFGLKYGEFYSVPDVERCLRDDPGLSIALCMARFKSGFGVFLTIDNYDSILSRARPSDRAAIEKFLDEYFFLSISISYFQGNYHRIFFTGEMEPEECHDIIPEKCCTHLERFGQHVMDLTHDVCMQEVFGFTEKEVRALDGALEGKDPAAVDVIEDLRARGIDSCNFNSSSKSAFILSDSAPEPVYSMQDVLDVLSQRIGKPNRQ